jgi:SAM-dependent methyltransferase
MAKLYVQYGCGLSAPNGWINFDASPTLRIQKIPVFGAFINNKQYVRFPTKVHYGDIIKGLPIDEDSCTGVYCSHTLEHLALQDFRKALKNTYKILKVGGIFRCVVPDLEYSAREYIKSLDSGDNLASVKFMGNDTLLGIEKRPRGFEGFLRSFWGNSHHLWMWDSKSLSEELKNAGFTHIRACNFNDCYDEMFKYVEEIDRFEKAVATECVK